MFFKITKLAFTSKNLCSKGWWSESQSFTFEVYSFIAMSKSTFFDFFDKNIFKLRQKIL